MNKGRGGLRIVLSAAVAMPDVNRREGRPVY